MNNGHFPTMTDLLPHRAPMLLLRRVLSHSAAETRCEGFIEPAFAAACGRAAPAPFALELIAQAAAAHDGLSRGADAPKATRGLLLGSRRLQLHCRALPTGQALHVIVAGAAGPTPAAGGLIRFEGRVEDAAGRVLATGDATVLETRPEIGAA